MKRLCVIFVFTAVVLKVFAVSNSGFGIDAFNRSVSAVTRGSTVFSPVSFEIDCVIFSETFGALTRSKFAEAMGVLNGLESVYHPVHQDFSTASDPSFRLLSARAFCLPDEHKSNRAYRQWLQQTFSGEAFSFTHKNGAECWFRARMDGDMEHFSLSDKAAKEGRYSYFSIHSISCAWQQRSYTSNDVSSTMQFQLADKSFLPLPAMTGLCHVDIWKRKNSTVLHWVIEKGIGFFAIVPNAGFTVRDIRGELTSNTIVDLLSGVKSISEPNVRHEICNLTFPVIDITSESDMKLAFSYFQFPMTEMERMEPGIQPMFIKQCVRFRIHPESDVRSEVPQDNIPGSVQQIALNRPFVFFVFHERTQTVPVAGQFTGL